MKSFERPSDTTVQNSLDKLKSAFREALPLPDDVNYDHVEYLQTGGWDSIAHMKLIAAIENQFDLMLTTDELISLSSFSKAQELLQQHGVTFK
jgi:acyl carrier protein